MRASRLYLQFASNSAIDSMLSLYHNKLWNYYRIYGVEYKSNVMTKKEYNSYLTPYIYDSENSKYISNWFVAKYDENKSYVVIENLIDKYNIENEIVEYMKYGIIGKTIDLFNKKILIKNDEDINSAIDDIKNIKEQVDKKFVYNEFDKKYYNFKNEIVKLEKIFNNICNETKKLNDNINNMVITVSTNLNTAKNVVKKLNDIETNLNNLSNYNNSYRDNQEILYNKVSENYDKYKNDLNNENIEFEEETKIFIEDEFVKFFEEASDNSKNMIEIKKIDNSIESIKNDFISIYRTKIENDISIIEDLMEQLRDSDLSSEDKQEIRAELKEARDDLKYDLQELKDVISTVRIYLPDMHKLYKSSENENILDKIMSLNSDIILKIVLSIEDYSNLDTNQINLNNYNIDSKNNLINKFLVNEYIIDFFNFYTKKDMNKITPSNSDKYEVEYILSNNNNDKDNLKSVVNRIFLIRQAMNMVYLFTNSEKKNIARGFANLLFGIFSPVVVEIMFILILTAWGMAQSVSDVKKILNNKRVKLLHDNETFDFNIEDLLTFGKTNELNNEVNEDDKGIALNYEDYCRLLLYTINSEDVNSRLTQLINYNIKNEENTFDISNTFYSINANNVFICNHLLTNMLFFKPNNVTLYENYNMEISAYGDFLHLNE